MVTARGCAADGAAPRLEGHAQNVNGVAFTRDGRSVVTVGYDATLRIWPRDGAAGVITLPAPLNAVAVVPDGEIVTAGADGKVAMLSPAGELRGEVEAAQAPVIALAISADGKRVAAAGIRGSVAIIDRAARRIELMLIGPGLPVWRLPSCPAARFITGGADRVIRRWDALTGEPIGAAVVGAPADPLAPMRAIRARRSFTRRLATCWSPDEGNLRARRWPNFRPSDREPAGPIFPPR
jgi:cytochrome c